eukprot:5627488-Amphidinium_carterae.2
MSSTTAGRWILPDTVLRAHANARQETERCGVTKSCGPWGRVARRIRSDHRHVFCDCFTSLQAILGHWCRLRK